MRTVERIIHSHLAPVGTFSVRRALPDHDRRSIGPWVFLDHFGPFRITPGKDGVGAHPHAGIETVTYLLSGRNQHRDSAGHTGIVAAGGAQWMTAGRGIIHAEAPLAETEAEMTMHGIQLWTTLPRALKTMPPRYQPITADAIAEIDFSGARVRVVAGELGDARGDAKGPANVLMPTLLWHVTIPAGATFTAPIPDGFEIGAYVIAGHALVGFDDQHSQHSQHNQRANSGDLVVFDDTDGDVSLKNDGQDGDPALQIMLLGGAPAEGPLVFHGPFVMNSIEQVRAAERAYMTGAMGALA